jgi:hypothetical protein
MRPVRIRSRSQQAYDLIFLVPLNLTEETGWKLQPQNSKLHQVLPWLPLNKRTFARN